jgi:GrpB-like predicted nucleotidyltransferase (UPF0157 family)
MLGLKHGINALVDHNPEWSRSFMEERARIHAAIGIVARSIEHYGSTAVEGLKARPSSTSSWAEAVQFGEVR